MNTAKLLTGDVRAMLRTLAPDSVRCCVTSPPYWNLRDYGVEGQIGLEPTLKGYLRTMVQVFREVRRVLAKDGTLWVNMGDCYANDGGAGTQGETDVASRRIRPPSKQRRPENTKPKDLVGQPWELALALRNDGWYLRRDIIWHKPNCTPETVYDRPSTSHEYVFLLSKREKYYYDYEAIQEPTTGGSHPRARKGFKPTVWAHGRNDHRSLAGRHEPRPRANDSFNAAMSRIEDPGVRNARSVWTIPTSAYTGAHTATMPEELARRCLAAGSAVGDTVLDCFGGTGTTAAAAVGSARNAISIDIDSRATAQAVERIGPMFCEVVNA